VISVFDALVFRLFEAAERIRGGQRIVDFISG
jgi:hypothetical protein